MKYTNPNQQRMARKLAEVVERTERVNGGLSNPMYDAFASAMSTYIDSVLEPLLNNETLIEKAEARHEWAERKNREETAARYSRQRRLKRAIYSDIGDGVSIDVDSVGQRAGKQTTAVQTTANSTDPPTLEEYWGFMCNTERTEAREELDFLKSTNPEEYDACIQVYVSRIAENVGLVSEFLKVFGRKYAAATSPIHHLQPPAEKSPRLMEYWNTLERKRQIYFRAHEIAQEALVSLDERVYDVLFTASTKGICMTDEDRQEIEQDKREFMIIGQEDGLGDFVAFLAPPKLIGVENADDNDVIDDIMQEYDSQPTRAIAAPLDSDLKSKEPDGSKRVIEG